MLFKKKNLLQKTDFVGLVNGLQMNSRIQCIAVWSCVWWLLVRSRCLWIRWSIICLFTFSCAKRHFNTRLLRLADTGKDTVASLEQRCQKGYLALSDLQLFNPVYASRQYLLNTLKTNSTNLNYTGSINCVWLAERAADLSPGQVTGILKVWLLC